MNDTQKDIQLLDLKHGPTGAAKLLGVSPVTWWRWKKGKVEIGDHTKIVLKMLADRKAINGN